ncbi:hypothetical protein [Neptuniibacter halophilus]|uniref:hypothetical protein n=1 Tax=Neptuniibacter halophilus TaxID=651666 RepID=UPI002573E4A1|nr:hypothetical protein [Neptuniibacter halophilus]
MYFHRVLLLLIPALYMVLPLIIDSWQALRGPWYLPYFAWAMVILIAFLVEKRRHDV